MIPAIQFFKKIHPYWKLWTLLSMIETLPILSSWIKNHSEVTASDLVLPLFIALLGSGLVTWIFTYRFKNQPGPGLVGASLVMILLENFEGRYSSLSELLHALSPFSLFPQIEPSILALVFFLLLIALGMWLTKQTQQLLTRYKRESLDLFGGIALIIIIMFVLEALPVLHTLTIGWTQFHYRPPSLTGLNSAKSAQDNPDIYYIVLDRYTSQDVLKNQFSYDNSSFVSFLQNNGFSINPDAHNNYPYTTMSIASTLNANYLSDSVSKFDTKSSQTIEPYHDAIRYSSVITALKKIGYSYTEIGSWYEASNKAPLADNVYQPEGQLTVFDHQFTLNTFGRDYLTSSWAEELVRFRWHIGAFTFLGYSAINEADATPYKLQALNQIASQPSGGRFIFAHILVPHDPYYFNADGSRSLATGNDNTGEPIKEKYTNQVSYINSQIQPIIEKINAQSNGRAVIILQSDEGPYPLFLNHPEISQKNIDEELSSGSMLNWSADDLKMKFGTLAAYHIPGASTDALVQGGDAINIFRVIFNTYFGTRLPYAPRCYYAYPDGRSKPFVYENINQVLTGQTDSACPKDSVFPE